MGDSFTIQISPSLINRLIDDEDKAKKKTKKPRPKIPQEPRQPQTKINPSSRAPKVHNSGLQTPVFLPGPTPPPLVSIAELEVIQSTLRASEMVLEKLAKQEASMAQELAERAKELHDKEFKLPYQKPVPCVTDREACVQCYRENPKDPLKCARVVSSFADCARQASSKVEN